MQWTVDFGWRGHKSTVEATRQFNATFFVDSARRRVDAGAQPGNLVKEGPVRVRPAPASGQPSTRHRHQSGDRPALCDCGAPAAVAPTFTLPPDTPTSRGRPSGAIAPLPLTTSTDTYLFTAIVGTFVIGLLWLLWVASIKPILGR